MKSWKLVLLSVALTTLFLFIGYWLYHNYTSVGGAGVLVEEKLEVEDHYLINVAYQDGSEEYIEVPAAAWNLLEEGATYSINFEQKIFDSYKQATYIEAIDYGDYFHKN
ncbi:hypothetical protein [Salsuginibacillus kocurii]|uniref:hypothetical protein n=1 Tax=Salsuginibacillus kocurii TaxID=427078 RepID=UPI000381EAB8|nr:hypothetical protein [Salsuginibacillus kocurii]